MNKKYPNMWIGITDIQYNKDNVIESANVLYTDKTASELAILALRGDSVQPLYTTPDNCFHIGAVMWLKVAIPLDKNVKRPVICLDEMFPGCTALIDTGALIPVWTKDVKVLEALGAEKYKSGIVFGGFGGDTVGELYRMDLKLGEIIYPGIPIIAARDEKIPGYFLFSATMFEKMDYTISNSTKTFIIETTGNQVCYNLTFETENGLHVLCSCE